MIPPLCAAALPPPSVKATNISSSSISLSFSLSSRSEVRASPPVGTQPSFLVVVGLSFCFSPPAAVFHGGPLLAVWLSREGESSVQRHAGTVSRYNLLDGISSFNAAETILTDCLRRKRKACSFSASPKLRTSRSVWDLFSKKSRECRTAAHGWFTYPIKSDEEIRLKNPAVVSFGRNAVKESFYCLLGANHRSINGLISSVAEEI